MIDAERAELRDALLRGDRQRVQALIDERIEAGASALALLTALLGPALVEIGELWQTGRVGVARERLATHTAWGCVEALRGRLVRASPLGRRAVVACPAGEHHALGARIVAELLWTDGWEVDFLGADTPGEAAAEHCQAVQADLVVLDATAPGSRDGIRRAADLLRALPSPPFVLAGGPACRGDHALEVDAVAADAAAALQIARRAAGVAQQRSLDLYLREVGKRLRRLRHAHGLSQQGLAELAELDRTYVSGIERGRQNVTLGAVLRLANALGVPPSALLGDR